MSSFRRRPKSLTIFIVNCFFAPWNIVLQQWMVTVEIFQDTERLQQWVNAMLVNSFRINAFRLMEPYCSYIVTSCMFCVKIYAFPRWKKNSRFHWFAQMWCQFGWSGYCTQLQASRGVRNGNLTETVSVIPTEIFHSGWFFRRCVFVWFQSH